MDFCIPADFADIRKKICANLRVLRHSLDQLLIADVIVVQTDGVQLFATAKALALYNTGFNKSHSCISFSWFRQKVNNSHALAKSNTKLTFLC